MQSSGFLRFPLCDSILESARERELLRQRCSEVVKRKMSDLFRPLSTRADLWTTNDACDLMLSHPPNEGWRNGMGDCIFEIADRLQSAALDSTLWPEVLAYVSDQAGGGGGLPTV